MSDSLQQKIRTLLDELYRQDPAKPPSFFFEATYEALPELEELDPERVRQMVSIAFLQSAVDHASRAEELLRNLLARVRHEGNRSPEYVRQVERQHAHAVKRHAKANQRLDQIMKDSGDRS
jgi:hypothetical protein